jgi:hypothetical protein
MSRRAKRTLPITIIGGCTILIGIVHFITGGGLIFGGSMMVSETAENAGQWEAFLKIIGGMVAALGILFFLQGALMCAAGWGILKRRLWSWILTFIMALLTIFWGLTAMIINVASAWNILYGLVLVVYGVAALVLLIKRGKEF